jgi:hypothetical protein
MNAEAGGDGNTRAAMPRMGERKAPHDADSTYASFGDAENLQ